MIARLKGSIERKSPAELVLDVHGVGYGLLVPETVLAKLPEVGQEVALEVHTRVREDDISLYGFLTALEKDTFEILMTASGVGPKVALAVLSALEAEQALEAITQDDKTLFSGISGVGKKTVEKIFVEVREKAESRLLLERGEAGERRKERSAHPLPPASWMKDLEQALIGLGYREADLRSTLREIAGGGEARDFDQALRLALQLLSSGAPAKGLRGNA